MLLLLLRMPLKPPVGLDRRTCLLSRLLMCSDTLPQGNIAWDDEYCYIDDKFRKKVTESPGFDWVDEAKPHHFTKKEGFVATEPGAYLLLTVNTAETTQTNVRHPALPPCLSLCPPPRSCCAATSAAHLLLLVRCCQAMVLFSMMHWINVAIACNNAGARSTYGGDCQPPAKL